MVAHYQNFQLSAFHSIPLVPGGTPQPGSASSGDFQFASAGTFIANDGQVALFNGPAASYADCLSDTALSTTVSSVTQGQAVCYRGSSVLAAISVEGYSTSGGVSYATLSVTIWRWSLAGDSSSAASGPGASGGGKGSVVAHYQNFQLSAFHSIPLVPGGTPQPGSASSGDFQFASAGTFIANDGQVALFNGPAASYADCLSDTALSTTVSSVTQGQAVCYRGSSVLAAISVEGYSTSGGVSYATLSVTIWRWSP